MASSDTHARADRDTFREEFWLGRGHSPTGMLEGMHIHVHVGESAARPRSRAWMTWGGGALAVTLAFLAGQFTASPAEPRLAAARIDPRLAELDVPPDLAALPRLPLRPPASEVTPVAPASAGQPPRLPQLPPSLQQQLAQPPRIVQAAPPPVPPQPQPQPAGQPSAAPRNAFGLQP